MKYSFKESNKGNGVYLILKEILGVKIPTLTYKFGREQAKIFCKKMNGKYGKNIYNS